MWHHFENWRQKRSPSRGHKEHGEWVDDGSVG